LLKCTRGDTTSRASTDSAGWQGFPYAGILRALDDENAKLDPSPRSSQRSATTSGTR